jgi:hypothetical protein
MRIKRFCRECILDGGEKNCVQNLVGIFLGKLPTGDNRGGGKGQIKMHLTTISRDVLIGLN